MLEIKDKYVHWNTIKVHKSQDDIRFVIWPYEILVDPAQAIQIANYILEQVKIIESNNTKSE